MTTSTQAGAPERGRWTRLGRAQKAAVVATALVVPCCGGLVAFGAVVGAPPTPAAPTATAPTATAPAAQRLADPVATTDRAAGPTATAVPAPDLTTTATRAPRITRRTVTETSTIAFRSRTVHDPSMAKGSIRIRTRGAAGRRTLPYEVTLADGRQTGRRLLRTVVTKAPVTRVVVVGSRPAATPRGNCSPHYGGCVPIASDVDCAGGSGNGPAYVTGPVRVIDIDVYRLDNDHDGYGCDD